MDEKNAGICEIDTAMLLQFMYLGLEVALIGEVATFEIEVLSENVPGL